MADQPPKETTVDRLPLSIFEFAKADAADAWQVVNDNVMGGRSQGGFQIEDQVQVFAGRTNTNGGGFSSIRARGLRLDLSEREGIVARVRGDGREYTLLLETAERAWFFRVSYWSKFQPPAGEWTEVRLPFDSFYPTRMGQRLEGRPLDTSDIRGIGLMIYDKQDGPFRLDVDWIGAY